MPIRPQIDPNVLETIRVGFAHNIRLSQLDKKLKDAGTPVSIAYLHRLRHNWRATGFLHPPKDGSTYVGRPTKLTKEMENELLEHLATSASMDGSAIRNLILEKFGVVVSLSTVSRLLSRRGNPQKAPTGIQPWLGTPGTFEQSQQHVGHNTTEDGNSLLEPPEEQDTLFEQAEDSELLQEINELKALQALKDERINTIERQCAKLQTENDKLVRTVEELKAQIHRSPHPGRTPKHNGVAVSNARARLDNTPNLDPTTHGFHLTP